MLFRSVTEVNLPLVILVGLDPMVAGLVGVMEEVV